MSLLSVDLSDVHKMTARATRHLGELDSTMGDVVETAASRLRQGDSYQDRTGDLRASTQGESIRIGLNEHEATMAMAMPYASFVIGRGFSNWDDEVLRAEAAMGRALSAIATKITRRG